jgi:hypothetical protein
VGILHGCLRHRQAYNEPIVEGPRLVAGAGGARLG